MKKHLLRILSLILCFSCLFSFVACGKDGGDGTTAPSGTTAEPSDPKDPSKTPLSDLDFGGDRLIISVSANQDSEVTFRPADIYTRGPATYGAAQGDEVQQMVFNRNKKIKDDLGLNVVFKDTNLAYSEVLEDIGKIMQGGSTEIPDIYINDVYGLARAMLNGYLFNLKRTDQSNYLDLAADCWYQDYMEGLSFSDDKQYILAGDYFIDMIRMAWVFYVNSTLLEERFSGSSFGYDIDWIYEQVEFGEWDYYLLKTISKAAFDESGGNTPNTEDEKDACLGLIWPHVFGFVMAPSSGLTILEKNEKTGELHITKDTSDLFVFSEGLKELYETDGVYWRNNVLDSTTYFMKGNILFAFSVLGEMESTQMRELGFSKGVVPFPKYDYTLQEDYNTVCHDQSEVGAILASTACFDAATAYLQLSCEQSRSIMIEYFEDSLKLKYSEDLGTQKSLDIIRDSICSPMEIITLNALGVIVDGEGIGIGTIVKEVAMGTSDGGFIARYDAVKEAFDVRLQKGLKDYWEPLK